MGCSVLSQEMFLDGEDGDVEVKYVNHCGI